MGLNQALAPHPPDSPGLIRIPQPSAAHIDIRYAPLAQRDTFDPTTWPRAALTPSVTFPGWWEISVDALALPDDVYEYEFLIDGGSEPVADPYADEITRFGGYRGLFHISGGKRQRRAFQWNDEFIPGKPLRQNNAIVVYEMPLKWMSNDPQENNPLAELGTFDKVIFEHFDQLVALGTNCIELLPIEDTSQTLNWGYGTRFFFAPDYDMGTPIDAKFFIKSAHQRGIRVILDVVMDFFSPTCPLGMLAPSWYSVPAGTDGRQDWGQSLFRFNTPSYDSYYAAREFLYEMAAYWISEYHIDGFRIDDFADIGNWDFGQAFRERAWAASGALSNKPFIVIAEDSGRSFRSTDSDAHNGKPVVDAIWNFGYRDEVRRLAKDQIDTAYGQPSRSDRVRHLLSKDGVWNAYGAGSFDPGYADLACSIDYVTSHDVQDAPRLMNDLLGSILRDQSLGNGDVHDVRAVVDGSPTDARVVGAVSFALYRVLGVFSLLMTSVGIPMFLAGEEFADVHDLNYANTDRKQQDPVQWLRASLPGHSDLLANVSKLIALRVTHAALQRNEIDCFYFHPQFDDNQGSRVFGYCRSNGTPLGDTGQVVVLANMGAQKFPLYDVPGWPWQSTPLTEVVPVGNIPAHGATQGVLSLSLDAFQVRVFTT